MMATSRVAAVVLLLSALSLAQQPSLADIARQSRQQRKPSTKIITNEDLPQAVAPSLATADTVSAEKQGAEEKDKQAAKDGPEVQKELEKAFLARYTKEKSELDLLNRELNVLQRENEIQITNYYADAGARFRDPSGFYQKSKEYTDNIAIKQKAIEEAKQRIEDLKEEARHAGLSSRLFE